MCADVVNALKLYLDEKDKLVWFLNHTNYTFLSSQEYLNLHPILQNILFFSTIVRLFNKTRWNYIIKHVETELKSKLNFKNKIKFKVLTWLDKLRVK